MPIYSLPLENAKKMMAERINVELPLFRLYELNPDTSRFMIDLAFLHSLIILTDWEKVDGFLHHYWNMNGPYFVEMFVNYPIHDYDNKRIMTPLDCATLWSDDPRMIRTLYRWGASMGIPNVDGTYLTDINELPPYSNYLAPYILCEKGKDYPLTDERDFGPRASIEFANVLNEIDLIIGKGFPPNGWKAPTRIEALNRY
jgi:hypothetical protein